MGRTLGERRVHSTLAGRATDKGRQLAGTGGSKAGYYDGRVLSSRVTAPSSHSSRRPLARNLAPLSHSWRTIQSEFTLVTSSFLPNPVTQRAPDSSAWGQNGVLRSCVTSCATQESGSSSLFTCPPFPRPSQGPCGQSQVAGLGNRVSPQVGG